MSMPIKFRLWNKEQKRFIFCYGWDYVIGCSGDVYMTNYNASNLDIINISDYVVVVPFTGLVDCDGKEIWDGDILQHTLEREIVLLVEFRRGAYRIIDVGNTSHNGCEDGLLDEIDGHHLRYSIIGNKFEHPEVLR